MGKQKKGGHASDRDSGADQGVGRAPEVDPMLLEQGALGNQAVQAQLGGESAADGDVGLDVVRDVAVPLVDRASLALELGPVDPARHQRFVDILDGSKLPDDRRQVLLDKLSTDAAASGMVQDAVARWFGAFSPALRSDVSRVLDAVRDGLISGLSVPLSDGALAGSVAARASALVGDVAEVVAPPGPAREGARGGVGAAVRGLCRDVVLAAAFDDEEEEEEVPGWEVEAPTIG